MADLGQEPKGQRAGGVDSSLWINIHLMKFSSTPTSLFSEIVGTKVHENLFNPHSLKCMFESATDIYLLIS